MTTVSPFPAGSVKGRLLQHLLRSKNDPSYFNDVILQRGPMWSAQKEWSEAVVAYRQVCIESGNMTGKGWWIAGLILWYLWTRRESLVYVTGPGQTSLGAVLWKEVRRAVEGSRFWRAGLLPAVVSPGIKASPATVVVRPGWQALGFSTTSVERASGHHAKSLLVVCEEASGIEQEAWDAIESLGYERLVAIGNPIRADGHFALLSDQGDRDALEHRPPQVSCKHFVVPSTMSPHAHLARSPVGLADKVWLEAVGREPGENSPWYRSHVLAQRPKLASETLIPPEWLNLALSDATAAAVKTLRAGAPIGKVRLGCDVGEGVGRSQSVIVVRDDLGVLEIFANQFESKAETAHAICGLAQKWQIGLEGIIFDGNGNTGRDILRALERRYPYGLVPFFGSRPGGRWYTNLRTACAAALARRLDPDPARGLTTRQPFAFPNGPHIPALFKELGELRYKLKGQKSELEPKEDMMIRLGRSPDFCDALTMTFRDEAFQGL